MVRVGAVISLIVLVTGLGMVAYAEMPMTGKLSALDLSTRPWGSMEFSPQWFMNVSVGDSVSFDIMINTQASPATNPGAITFEINYDQNVVRPTAWITDYTDDPEVAAASGTLVGNLNYEVGTIRITGFAVQGFGTSYNLAIGKITFKVVGSGDGLLTITPLKLADTEGREIPVGHASTGVVIAL